MAHIAKERIGYNSINKPHQNLRSKFCIKTIAILCIELIILFPIINALTISDISVSDITANSAKISWKTEIPSNGTVEYGDTSKLGTIRTHKNLVINHEVILPALTSETQYFFSVKSENEQSSLSDNNSGNFYAFTTPDVTPPEKVKGIKIDSLSTNSVSLTWEPTTANDFSHYNIYKNFIKTAQTEQNEFTDTNLISSTTYTYKVSAVDKSGNEGVQSEPFVVKTFLLDEKPPKISSIRILKIEETSATINFITDENSTSIIYYGQENLSNTFKDDKLVTNHTITITSLAKEQQYKYIVSACDVSNNCLNSSEQGFISGIDINAPKINLEIPQFINTREIDIIGTTEPFSEIRLYVNNFKVPVRFTTTNAEGNINFQKISLEKENIIKIDIKDSSGNKNEKTFHVSVDTQIPEVVIEPIPNITTKKNISIIGSVDEPVQIKISISQQINFSVPEKIARLIGKAGNNSVVLEWNKTKIENFGNYIIYRNNKPIAATSPISYNTFTDLLTNSGETYTYHVTVVTEFGKESPKSNPVTITIPSGGKKNLPGYNKTMLSFESLKPETIINSTGAFSENIRLGNDGTYGLLIEFIDRAGNKAIIERQIILDTKAPDIKIINPTKGTSIYENYANQVDIQGITEPNSEVHLFVQRTPVGFLNKSFSVTGLEREIQNIPESKLRASCRLEIGSKSFCQTGADFSTVSDDEGNFFFEDIDLTNIFSGAFSTQELPLTEFSEDFNTKESRRTTLIFIATDKTGLRGAESADYRIINCRSGNQTWDILPLTEFQSPTLINTERLAEGTENIEFYFNFTYNGEGVKPIITDVTLTKACEGSQLFDNDRFNISCKILPPGAESIKLNQDGTIRYSIIKLNSLPNMNRWLEDDWKNFFNQLGTEITFPFKIRITYKHNINSRELTSTQTTCQEVTYFVDNSKLDPRKLLPDFLLYDFVNFLDESIATLKEVKRYVDTLVQYVAVGCVGSFILRFAVQWYRTFITFIEEKKFLLSNVTGVEQLSFNDNEKQYCIEVSKNIIRDIKLTNYKNLKLKHFSDEDLRKCFPNVASAWDTEASLYQAFRFTCDRFLGRRAPSRWTEEKDDDDLKAKLQLAEGCAIDQSVRGHPLRAVKCRQSAQNYKTLIDPNKFSLDETCFEVFDPTGRKATLYQLDLNKQTGTSNIVGISKIPGQLPTRELSYAIKANENNYLTALPKTCAEICGTGGTLSSKEPPKGYVNFDPKREQLPVSQLKDATSTCVTTNFCKSLNQKTAILPNQQSLEIKTAVPSGFGLDCFYRSNEIYPYSPIETNNPEAVSNNPNDRYECCCINSVLKQPTTYYHFNDKNKYQPVQNGNPFAHQLTSSGSAREKYSDIKWSYRYWKERYETFSIDENGRKIMHFEYNPNRYIEGRDRAACFGMDNIFYEFFKGPESLVVIDPAKQFSSTFQCANVGGISNRITEITNIMNALSACLKQVRLTGNADSGVCKEIFTRFVCSTIWDVISMFRDGCVPFGTGINFEEDSIGLTDYLKGGFQSFYSALGDNMRELQSEYGNAKLNNLLGSGEDAVARKICLGAFGYDWEMSFNDIVDIAYAQPFSSLVMAPTASREFLTVDPRNGQAKYEYRASWLINPGCDLENYKIDLACVGRNQIGKYPGINCEKVNDPDGNNCDCKNLNDEKIQPNFYSASRRIKQNVLENKDENKIYTSAFRYDHLKFTLRPDRRISQILKDKCFPDGHFDGSNGVFYEPIRDKTARDLASCQVDVISGFFQCKGPTSLFSDQGIAYFISEKINDQLVGRDEILVKEGDPIIFQPYIYKSPDDKKLCLIIDAGGPSIPYTIDLQGPREYSIPISPSAFIIRDSRINSQLNDCEFIDQSATGQANIQTACRTLHSNKKLSLRLLAAPDSDVSIKIKFIDMGQRAGVIDISEDSPDIIVIDNTPRTIGKTSNDNGLYVRGQGLVIDLQNLGFANLQNNGKFIIQSVDFDRNLKSITFDVNIQKLISNRPREETLNIRYGIYPLKDQSFDCSSYNPADLITAQGRRQENTARIRITSRAISAEKPRIAIKAEAFEPENINDMLVLTAEVTDDKGIVPEIRYNLFTLEGNKIVESSTTDCVDVPSEIGKSLTCQIKISQNNLLGIGGTYKIEVQATDNDGNKITNTRSFEISCVSNQFDKWGICLKEGDNCRQDPSKTQMEKGSLSLACPEKFYCCLFKSK